MTRRSYCLFSGMDAIESGNRLVLGGLFAWEKAFHVYGSRGYKSANLVKDLLEEFDLIHVNYTPRNASYIAAIRDSLGDHSDTKIIAQVDYSVGLWNSIDPLVMRQQLGLADFVFHVEPVGASILSDYLGRTVPVIPHPVDVSGIVDYRQKQPSMPPIVSCQYHRYMYTWHPYYYGTYKSRRDYGVRVALMNYTDGAVVPLDGFFDEVIGRGPYEGYIGALSHVFTNIDITPDYTFGRGIVESAALGVPTIGSISVRAANHIWPELAVPPYDVVQIKRVLECLFTDPEFSSAMSKQGIERSWFYSLENSYDRLVSSLEEFGVL